MDDVYPSYVNICTYQQYRTSNASVFEQQGTQQKMKHDIKYMSRCRHPFYHKVDATPFPLFTPNPIYIICALAVLT